MLKDATCQCFECMAHSGWLAWANILRWPLKTSVNKTVVGVDPSIGGNPELSDVPNYQPFLCLART